MSLFHFSRISTTKFGKFGLEFSVTCTGMSYVLAYVGEKYFKCTVFKFYDVIMVSCKIIQIVFTSLYTYMRKNSEKQIINSTTSM